MRTEGEPMAAMHFPPALQAMVELAFVREALRVLIATHPEPDAVLSKLREVTEAKWARGRTPQVDHIADQCEAFITAIDPAIVQVRHHTNL